MTAVARLPDDGLSERLNEIDWSFSKRAAPSVADGLHPYPAKFIPEIPHALLSNLPLSHDSMILDPFCGSGTSLAVAQAMGFSAIGVDLNPIACLISRVRTAALPVEALAEVTEVLERAKRSRLTAIPDIPNLDHWFEAPVQIAIARLVSAIGSSGPSTRDFLRLALSSVLVRVSNQDSDTRYAAVVKNVSERLVYLAFEAAAIRIAGALSAERGGSNTRVIQRDTLSLSPEDIAGKVSAIITSPPYPNAYEYWLYHKYRMWWLGYDPIETREKEIGARAHFFGSKRHDGATFVFQMKKLFDLIEKVLLTDGYACFVVGRSKIHGTIVDNAAIIRAAAEKIGMREVFSVERSISATSKSFNLSHANIKTETVLVFGR